ncbi:hypothetical protein [Thalassotalea insulae]|nr:hypothetical protein [Thalassotalea insulae]
MQSDVMDGVRSYGRDSKDMLHSTDVAMYAAKAARPNDYKLKSALN